MASVELTGLACLRRTPPPLPHNRIHCSRVWCRAQMPPGLDPAAGDLKQARAIRKRLQLFSLASVSMRMVLHLATQRRKSSSSNGDREDIEGGGSAPPPLRITDFGAGSGHLGLILAWAGAVALGDGAVAVTLLDRKGFGCDQSERRVADAGLAGSVAVVEMDALEYTSPVDLGVSLHSCGVLTDIAHQACLDQRAAFVLCPCCYGQLNDMYSGVDTILAPFLPAPPRQPVCLSHAPAHRYSLCFFFFLFRRSAPFLLTGAFTAALCVGIGAAGPTPAGSPGRAQMGGGRPAWPGTSACLWQAAPTFRRSRARTGSAPPGTLARIPTTCWRSGRCRPSTPTDWPPPGSEGTPHCSTRCTPSRAPRKTTSSSGPPSRAESSALPRASSRTPGGV